MFSYIIILNVKFLRRIRLQQNHQSPSSENKYSIHPRGRICALYTKWIKSNHLHCNAFNATDYKTSWPEQNTCLHSAIYRNELFRNNNLTIYRAGKAMFPFATFWTLFGSPHSTQFVFFFIIFFHSVVAVAAQSFFLLFFVFSLFLCFIFCLIHIGSVTSHLRCRRMENLIPKTIFTGPQFIWTIANANTPNKKKRITYFYDYSSLRLLNVHFFSFSSLSPICCSSAYCNVTMTILKNKRNIPNGKSVIVGRSFHL